MSARRRSSAHCYSLDYILGNIFIFGDSCTADRSSMAVDCLKLFGELCCLEWFKDFIFFGFNALCSHRLQFI